MDLQSITRWLARGSDAARDEAQRVLEELLRRGDVSAEEAEEIRAGIAEAVEANRRFLQERVGGPLREVLGALAGLRDQPPSDRERSREGLGSDRELLRAILARLDELAERVGRLESRLGGGGRE